MSTEGPSVEKKASDAECKTEVDDLETKLANFWGPATTEFLGMDNLKVLDKLCHPAKVWLRSLIEKETSSLKGEVVQELIKEKKAKPAKTLLGRMEKPEFKRSGKVTKRERPMVMPRFPNAARGFNEIRAPISPWEHQPTSWLHFAPPFAPRRVFRP